MMAERPLDARGRAEVEDVVIRAPGLEGDVSVERPPAVGGRRSRGRKELDDALARLDMVTEREVVIADPRHVGPQGGRTRGGAGVAGTRSPRLTLTVPGPSRGREQAVLSIDEHGVATWHFQGSRRGGKSVRGGTRTRTYAIERGTVAPRGTGQTRGLVAGVDKVFLVITFPVAKATGREARFAVRDWDSDWHRAQVRSYGATGRLTELSAADWDRLSTGPSLLFVHGTFDTTEHCFGRLARNTKKELDQRYDGRVIAYDHPTIAGDPIENARRFLEIVGSRDLQVDIVCHSRGGLVARALAERPGDLVDYAPGVRVRNIVFVGVPNNGTILAEPDHWNELVDRATTLLNLTRGPGVSDALQTVVALVRSIAVKTAVNLAGIDAMAPHSDFLKRLNVASQCEADYRAVVSDFEPKNPGLLEWLSDEVRDEIFGHRPNDMMVTIDSMTGENGSSRFPVKEIRGFTGSDAVEHAHYFPQKLTTDALLEWLPG
jgi:pimeloyl-ACP methyl ester carboxylesterase